MASAFITGLAGTRLTVSERAFLRASEPAGVILFARNCESGDQIRRLLGEAGDAIGSDDVLFLIDQEGGRVQRLGPPGWRSYPSAADMQRAFERRGEEALLDIMAVTRLLAADLSALGFNVNCAPVLDLRVDGAHDIIGPRAYGPDVETIVTLATAVSDGLRASAIAAVGKHIPGHGRARADTHEALAIVEEDASSLEATDFAPFRQMADVVPAMMTAHVVYPAIDETEPASTSARVHADIIRGTIGFGGLVMSDDLSMAALDGQIARRAERVLAAGSDLALHCNGEFAEMEAIVNVVPRITGACGHRIRDLHLWRGKPDHFEESDGEAALARIKDDGGPPPAKATRSRHGA
jgi:beta-N-acetylhexosaminidase